MITPCFDDNFFPEREPPQKKPKKKLKRDKLENHDGSTMFIADAITIEIEEEEIVKFNPNSPLSFKGGLGIAGSTLLIVGTAPLGSLYERARADFRSPNGSIYPQS